MNKTNQGIITNTIDRVLQENPDMTMPEFLGKMMDNNISFTIDSFRGQHNAAMRYRVNGETGSASNISDDVTIGGLQKRGVTYQSSLHKEDMVLLAQRSMKEGVGDRTVAPVDKRRVIAEQQTEVYPQLDQPSEPMLVQEEQSQSNQSSEDNEYADSIVADLANVLQEVPKSVRQEEDLEVVAEVSLDDRLVVSEKSTDTPLEPSLIDGNSEYVEQVYTELTDTLEGEQERVPLVQEEDEGLFEPVALSQEEEEQLNQYQFSGDNDYADSIVADLANALQEVPESVRQEEELEVVEPEEKTSVTNEEGAGAEEPELVALNKEEKEEPAAAIQKEEKEPEKRVSDREAESVTLREKAPVTVEQSAIETINFMLDLLQADKFHPTSKIAEADRYSFSRSEEGGVQINDTYNKGRVVFQTDKDNNVKISNFKPDEEAKFTALFTKLQKDEKKLRSIRPNLKSGDKLTLTNQDIVQPSRPDIAQILEPPAKPDFKAIYEPIRLTLGRIIDWTKDAYLIIKDPQERQEIVNMLGDYRDKINEAMGTVHDPIVLSEKDFQTISTLERNSHDLRSTRDGVVTRDQAINDNSQVRAELGLIGQSQVQKPVPVQSQR